jgi:alpha-N-arabinofuranosidase
MYYLLISEGGTEAGHMVTMARADNPWGPFVPCPFNPILTNRDDAPNVVQNTGHADIVQDPEGKWWMVHLAVRSVNKFHHLGRETFLLPVDWNEDGWPIINKTGKADLEIYTQAPAEQKKIKHYGKYDFSQKNLGPEWNYLRNPHIENYSIDEVKGILHLKTSFVRLDDKGSPTFIGIRQKDFDIELSTRMIFKPDFEGEEAGITAFMNNEHYFSVGMVRTSKGNFVRATAKTGKLKHTIAEVPVKQDEIFLKISADKFVYRFLWSDDGETWQSLGENYAKYISTEVADGFTGVYLAMYAESNSKQSGSIANFDWFKYE